MNISNIYEQFKNIDKGPRRSFLEKKYQYFSLFSLPNGISIFHYQCDLIENNIYKKNDFVFEFDFKVIENKNNLVIIKKL